MHTLYARFNTGLLVFIALTGIVLVTMLATRAYGGPLDPPGAPAPTMKTLQQVEPRTPISQPASAAGFPIQINAPGSYYFTGNITGVVARDGIVINADNVTLDLNGFTLLNGGLGYDGIVDDGQPVAWRNLTLRNGTISGWGYGVVSGAVSSTYEDLNVSNNTHGLVLGSSSNVRRVVGWNHTGTELAIVQAPNAWGSIVEDSNFSFNTLGIQVDANNVRLHGNIVHSNTQGGITVEASRGFNEIIDNSIIGNGLGVYMATDSNSNVVAGNTLGANTTGPLTDDGRRNHVGSFVVDVSLTGGNQYSNIVY